MPTHTVKQGETVPGIALHYGFQNWRAIYDHPNNQKLKDRRKNPNVLLPGDTLWLPERKTKEEEGETGRRHKFRLKREQQWLRIILQDVTGAVMKGVAYTLVVEGKTFESETNEEGLLEHEIPTKAQKGKLSVRKGKTVTEYELKIGHLDPEEETSGWKARLNNLGFRLGSPDEPDEESNPVKSGVEEYQCEEKMEPSGEIDDKTRNRLKESHGS
jgi:N-acetylmuramoyl-L-alanine amidase